jgi:hypothetical protein
MHGASGRAALAAAAAAAGPGIWVLADRDLLVRRGPVTRTLAVQITIELVDNLGIRTGTSWDVVASG